jgi:hypothetical protein
MRPRRRALTFLWQALALAALLLTLLTGCDLPFPFPQPTLDAKLPDSQQALHISIQSIFADGNDSETPDPATL